jgi:P pilus assembly chaperone PapD
MIGILKWVKTHSKIAKNSKQKILSWKFVDFNNISIKKTKNWNLQFSDNSTRAQSKKINFFQKSIPPFQKPRFWDFFYKHFWKDHYNTIKVNHKIWVECTFNDNWNDLK